MASFADKPPAAEQVSPPNTRHDAGRTLIRTLPLRDRLVILSALGIVTLLAWVYLVDMAIGMKGMKSAEMGAKWTTDYFIAMLLMWAIMMVGMMVPSAIPMVLIHAAIAKKAARDGKALAPTGLFVVGYVLIWTLFSIGATTAQWGLDRASLLSSMMTTNSPILGGSLLLTAGLYQLTPMKNACLRHCRSPVHFIASAWRPGHVGAVRMGIVHGAHCLGCCWILMCLLFFGGVMSIWWIAGLTTFVLVEKIMPFGPIGGRVLGLAVAAWGIVLLFSAYALH